MWLENHLSDYMHSFRESHKSRYLLHALDGLHRRARTAMQVTDVDFWPQVHEVCGLGKSLPNDDVGKRNDDVEKRRFFRQLLEGLKIRITEIFKVVLTGAFSKLAIHMHAQGRRIATAYVRSRENVKKRL